MAGRITRRELLSTSLKMSAAFGAAPFALAACGGSTTGPGATGAAATAGVATASAAASSASTDPIQRAYDGFVKQETPGVSIDLVRAAAKEGKLVVYAGPNSFVSGLADLWKKTFPFIEYEAIYLNGGPLQTRFMSEQAGKQYLVDTVTFTNMKDANAAINAGYVMSFVPTAQAEMELSTSIPGQALALDGQLISIAYNPNRLKDSDAVKLETWDGLLDTTFNGRRFGLQPITLGRSLLVMYSHLYDIYGTRVWELMAKSYVMQAGGEQVVSALLSGEVDLGPGVTTLTAAPHFNKGEPIHFKAPTPAIPVTVMQAVAKNAAHPNAAKLYQEFCLSPAGQALAPTNGAVSFRNKRVAASTGSLVNESWFKNPPLSAYLKINDATIDANSASLTERWKTYFK